MSASFLRCPERVVWSDLAKRDRELRLDVLEFLRRGDPEYDEIILDRALEDSEFGKQHALAAQLPPRLLSFAAPHSVYLHAYFLLCLAPLVPVDEDARLAEDAFVVAMAPFFTMDYFRPPYALACTE